MNDSILDGRLWVPTGYGSLFQAIDVALIGEAGHRTYKDTAEHVSVSTHHVSEYRILSDNVDLAASIPQDGKPDERHARSNGPRLTLRSTWKSRKHSSPPLVAVSFERLTTQTRELVF